MYERSGRIRFSLVALVVIILVIAGLVYHVCIVRMSYFRVDARRAKCLSNLRQIGLALAQYSMDYDDTFPWDSSESDDYYRFLGKLHPSYEKRLSVFRCPSSSDSVMKLGAVRADGSLFTEWQCSNGLSYAYGHNQGKPWKENDPSSVRLAADKYATHDYTSEPYPGNRPLNHSEELNFWGVTVRNVRKFGERFCTASDGSVRTAKDIGPLEADPETEFENSGDRTNDQTGPDWWSDPPDK